ncbi:MAG: glycosyltransferase [Sphingomonadales bacterium]
MSIKKRLHIVCPIAPWPLTSGSNIDMFYRIRALHAEGVEIVLHYFAKPEERHPTELNPYCQSIHIYPLEKNATSSRPNPVRLRQDKTLLSRLLQDPCPVLLEGLSCCGYLQELVAVQKKVVVRIQQLQHRHIKEMSAFVRNPLQWLIRLIERKKMIRFKRHLPSTVIYACANEGQVRYYREDLGLTKAVSLPVFSPYYEVLSKEGIGSFCLFQGNLSEKETEKMLIWLLTKVFSRISIPFVIAGQHPSAKIEKLVHLYQHTCLVADPGESELNDLIQKAQTHVLLSSVSAGTNIRVLHALSMGRHCICNSNAVQESPLKEACYLTESASGVASLIMQLQHRLFGEEEILLRKRLIQDTFDTKKNTKTLIQYLW